MTELSSGSHIFTIKNHNLALAICNGLRTVFGKGTPEFYKKLAYKCINKRPTAEESKNTIY